MKDKLQQFSRKKMRFTATVGRFGWRKPQMHKRYQTKTILLVNLEVESTGEIVADHVWLDVGKWSLGLKVGSKFSFDAKVKRYEKGYKGFYDDDGAPVEQDYRLEKPSNVRIKKK